MIRTSVSITEVKIYFIVRWNSHHLYLSGGTTSVTIEFTEVRGPHQVANMGKGLSPLSAPMVRAWYRGIEVLKNRDQ